ncbi:hypothetical protein [Photobacterium sanguinicancri]|uniref:hypothetical protein n=1 Tax=Photobacterium sanguinicancri TaxID=875932 RepID=UPI0021C36EAA|nr:hypothetical protein [Photobacterium sanguinicancri]
MICLDTNIAQLLTFDFWDKRADIFMMTIAGIALAFTVAQLRSGRRESRRATAYSAYQEYLKLCFENPDFAYGDQSTIKKNGKTNPKYPWFVSQMLFTFEQVLESDKSDNEWKTAIKSQLKMHKWYLKTSNSIERPEWRPELMAVLNEALKDTREQHQEERLTTTEQVTD